MPGKYRAKAMRLARSDYLPGERQLRKLFGIKEKSGALRGEARLRRLLRLRGESDLFGIAQQNSINVLLPLLDLPPWKIAPSTIGWIPDFQHVHLPEFFGPGDLQRSEYHLQAFGRESDGSHVVESCRSP